MKSREAGLLLLRKRDTQNYPRWVCCLGAKSVDEAKRTEKLEGLVTFDDFSDNFSFFRSRYADSFFEGRRKDPFDWKIQP